ncbi:unnamed protein product, partial [Rotaria sp. Silwood2]
CQPNGNAYIDTGDRIIFRLRKINRIGQSYLRNNSGYLSTLRRSSTDDNSFFILRVIRLDVNNLLSSVVILA